jgi:hypothetical protein
MIDMRIEEALEDVEQLFARAEAGDAHPYWILKPRSLPALPLFSFSFLLCFWLFFLLPF